MRNTSRIITKASRNRLVLAVVAAGLTAAAFAGPSRSFAAAPEISRAQSPAAEGLAEVDSLLEEWRAGEAYAKVKSLIRKHPDDDWVKFALARCLFLLNDYSGALEALKDVGSEDVRNWRQNGRFIELARATREATRGMTSRESEHFRIFFMPGKDEILVDEGLQALEAAWRSLGERFDFRPESKIVVEIYPTVDSFVAVSTLSREAIQTSGTIALCKFNRLMLTSPRLLHLGYRWKDTLTHEYVHYLIYRKSRAVCPVWLHEGLAIYNEERWRRDSPAAFEPSQESLLANALKKGRLVTLNRMHPSFALLTGKNESALAFAEVYDMMKFMEEKWGAGIQKNVLENMAEEGEFVKAFRKTFGMGINDFYKEWEARAKTRNFKEIPGIEVETVKLKEGEDYDRKAEEESLTLDIGEEKARGHSRIGDLLIIRGRALAASREYEKAAESSPMSSIVRDKLGKSRLKAGEAAGLTGVGADMAKKAVEDFRKAIELRPSYPNAYANLGRAYFLLGDNKKAVREYLEALEINPFHLPVQEALAEAYRAMGDEGNWKKRLAIVEKLKG